MLTPPCPKCRSGWLEFSCDKGKWVCIRDNHYTDGCGYEEDPPLFKGVPYEPNVDFILDIAEQLPELLAEYIKEHPGFQKTLDIAKEKVSHSGGSYAGSVYNSPEPLQVGYVAGGYTIIAMEKGEKVDGADLYRGLCVWESKTRRSFILDRFAIMGNRKKFVRISTFTDRGEALVALNSSKIDRE